jgi:2-polyprenyl-6-methoxyphenol hydroxylase-like FAD-dependent oxidoreductase
MNAVPDILIVGAGPTGLTLALQANAHGASVRIVECRVEEFRPSRALIMHPRTLEVLRPLGVTPALLERAIRNPRVVAHLGRRGVPIDLSTLSIRDTAYPHPVLIRQADVEDVLAQALAERGVCVERGTRLAGYRAHDGVVATLDRAGHRCLVESRFLVGCDGPDSIVRRRAGIAWEGAAYRHDVVLADLALDGDVSTGDAHVVAARDGLLFLFPLGEYAEWRLLATEPAVESSGAFGQPGASISKERLAALLARAPIDVRIASVAWSARVRLQRRLASQYRAGPVFLAGDAAHTHSPAGGQGMNTGIQDAANLGWKLALAGECDDMVLDSYQIERRPVARRVLALQHLIFWAEAGTDPIASTVRSVLAPLAAPLVPVLLRRSRLPAYALGLLGQMRWHYRRSPLSVDLRPTPEIGARAGERLPDQPVMTESGTCLLHELTAAPGIHLLLARDAADPGASVDRLHHVHRVLGWPGAGFLVVRPDGYVALRGTGPLTSPRLRTIALPAILHEWLLDGVRHHDLSGTPPVDP